MKTLPIHLSLLLLAGPILARENPAWTRTECPFRVVFDLPERPGHTVLLTVPALGAPLDPAGFEALSSSGQPLPVEVIHIGREEAQVLVRTGESQPKGEFVLYYGGSGRPAGTAIRDPSPFHIEQYRLPGGSVPNSWDKALYLVDRSGRPFTYSYESALGSLPQQGHGKGATIAVIRSMLRCPEDGVYTFGIRARGVAFLAVDGELVAEQLDPHADDPWREGTAVRLEKGVHRVRICSFEHGENLILPGWIKPGTQQMTAIPEQAFCTATEITRQRVERLDSTLHPGFTHDVLTPYTFEGNPAVFVPVLFRNTSRNWLARNTGYRWDFSGGAQADDENPRHVFVGTGLHRAALSIRDSLGYEAAVEQDIDCRFGHPVRHTVATEIVRLPPVCYPSDIVEPALRVSGDVPATLALAVTWTMHGRKGKIERTREVSLVERYVDVPLGCDSIRDLARITWRIQHHGVSLASGEIVFARPPFEARPATVSANHLFDRQGRLLVLVPYQYGGQHSQPPISTQQAFGQIACVDDSLASPYVPGSGRLLSFDRILARIVDGPERPIVRYVTPPAWSTAPQASGRLLKLVKVPADLEQPTDVAILSLSARDLLATQDVEQFEREAAALTDLLSATMGIPVVWVTPPPYPPEPAAIRPYAAAVQKIASARHIPVADLFTAFLASRPNFRDFFHGDDLLLSQRGQELAARIIARALLSTSGERNS